jgi:hypothetical protein
MVQNAGDFTKQGTDVLGADWDVDVQQLLDSQREALLVGHHRDIIESVKVWQGLEVCPVLDELLCASVQQSNVGVGAHNLLSVQLQNQAQHTVGSGMLGSEVDSVMPDLPGVYTVILLGPGFLARLGWCDAAKAGIGRDQSCALALLDFSVSAGECSRQVSGNGS